VKRTTNGKGLVSELTLQEIKRLKTDKDEHIPTLAEVFDLLGKRVKIFVELKEAGLEEQLLALIQKKDLLANVVVVSFLEDALAKVKALNPQIETGLIYVKHKNPIKAALALKAQWLVTLYRFTHTANVQKAHENGLQVLVWTVNTAEEAAAMAKKGVDGIATDKPDIL
jgi:glycerophosphoryl diester phosphodiesterase